jgi:hypothetical protein
MFYGLGTALPPPRQLTAHWGGPGSPAENLWVAAAFAHLCVSRTCQRSAWSVGGAAKPDVSESRVAGSLSCGVLTCVSSNFHPAAHKCAGAKAISLHRSHGNEGVHTREGASSASWACALGRTG